MNHKNYRAYLNYKNKERILDILKNHPENIVLKCGNHITPVVISKGYEYVLTNNGKIAIYNPRTGFAEEYYFTFNGENICLQ